MKPQPRRQPAKSKPRRVVVTLEIETDAPMDLCRSASAWQGLDRDSMLFLQESIGSKEHFICVLQASANVIRAGKKGGRR